MEQMSFINYLNVSDTEDDKILDHNKEEKYNENKILKDTKIKRKRDRSISSSSGDSRSSHNIRRKDKKRHSNKKEKRRSRNYDRKDKRDKRDRRDRKDNRRRKRSHSSSYNSDSRDDSDSRSRSRNKKRNNIKHNKRLKSNSSSKSSSKSIENVNKVKPPKWSSSEEIIPDNKIITLKSKIDKNLDQIKPNENIETIEKEKPNFEPSGLLAKQTNEVNGIVLKFTEPLDSSPPNEDWRLYTFKDCTNQDILNINNRSCYLIGKEEKVANILVNHPSCSRQHAVIQFRKVQNKNRDGNVEYSIKPYLMDLESTNGTLLNKEKIEPARYYELKKLDVINFGLSKRDYVVMKMEKEN